MFTFQHPWWGLALLALPLIALFRRGRRVPLLVVPFAAEWHRGGAAPTTSWPAVLSYLGAIALIAALARPQVLEQKREVQHQGYDIVLALDLSGSMRAEDYERDGQPINRLQALKPVLEAFISRRPHDRIGIVVFAGRAYTFAPLTFDHGWLRRQTGRLRIGVLEDGTAIGDGLGVALSRLDQGRDEAVRVRQGAFVILLTDGKNHGGMLEPRKAARLAKDRGVPVYTIGAGRDGIVMVPMPTRDGGIMRQPMRSDLDEPLLRDIANETGGKFFRAEDSRTIEQAFAAIDQAEKIEFQAQSMEVTDELFAWPATLGLALLAVAAAGSVRQNLREAWA